MKQFIKLLIPKKAQLWLWKIRNNYFDGYSVKSYSQEGEDMVLRRLFENQKTGFYVDVGAHHPFRFSNTYFFYKLGWTGINIDAMPGSMNLFKKFRPRDINLWAAIGDSGETLTYYSFNEPALNTFSKELAAQHQNNKQCFVEKEYKLRTFKLSEILEKNLPQNAQIDFLTIDVEGYDFYVLKSMDFGKFRPKVILVEIHGCGGLLDVQKNEIVPFLEEKGYVLFGKTVLTVLFIQKEFYSPTRGEN